MLPLHKNQGALLWGQSTRIMHINLQEIFPDLRILHVISLASKETGAGKCGWVFSGGLYGVSVSASELFHVASSQFMITSLAMSWCRIINYAYYMVMDHDIQSLLMLLSCKHYLGNGSFLLWLPNRPRHQALNEIAMNTRQLFNCHLCSKHYVLKCLHVQNVMLLF